MKQATLCLLIKDENGEKELLLAMKKRGFGVGKWNGVGGKLDPEKGDKDIVGAAIRETEEEIGVKTRDLEKVAVLNFRFPYKEEWNQDVHVFLARNWQGEPRESEEMMPKWFKESEIPFDEMWDDDKIWLPHVLEGKKLEADFIFREGEKIDRQNVRFV
ncbi:MAG: 8-oxo-dGTP diphosphatase [Candidatus Pacebacteria bacterium]|nr:8-oxo-dGTP diphosphatase [Candidatus Paceibacterota bacterium]